MPHTRAKLSALGLSALTLLACGETDVPPSKALQAPQAQGPDWLLRLDPLRGELPEGLALNAAGDTAFVGLAPTGKILAVDTSDGSARVFGQVPTPPRNAGYLLGLVANGADELFAAVASASPDYQPGVYRVPAGGGEATLFASHPELRFPNGLVFSELGELFVTDSLSGMIFRIDSQGQVSTWASDPLLTGATDAACANGAAFPIGANGIVSHGGAIFVVNTDHGSLLRIPILPDGSAGPIATLVHSNCAVLGGADGLAVDAEGTLYVAANAINAITSVTLRGEASVLLSGAGFDFPASIALGRGASGGQLFVTNAALKSAQTPEVEAHPGLVVLALGE